MWKYEPSPRPRAVGFKRSRHRLVQMTLLFPHKQPKVAIPGRRPWLSLWLHSTHRKPWERASARGCRLPVCTDREPSSGVRQGKWHPGADLSTFINTSQITYVIWVPSPDQCTLPSVRSLPNLLRQPPNLAALTSGIKNLSLRLYHLVAPSVLTLPGLSFLCKVGVKMVPTPQDH